MKAKLAKVAKALAYPLFYVICLTLFVYLSFPFDALKHRLIAEFDELQRKSQRRSGDESMRLELGSLSGYWFSGVEVENAKLIIPPEQKRGRRSSSLAGMAAAKDDNDEEPGKPSVIAVDLAQARVRLLPLLWGEVKIDFYIEALAGEIAGTVPVGADSGAVEVTFSNLQLAELGPLQALLQGLPLRGVLSGKLDLTPREGKFSQAEGGLELTISTLMLGDGKAKLQGVALPTAQGGQITIVASAQNGVLKLTELTGKGKHIELAGDGLIRLGESWSRSKVDIYLMMKFTDAYRDLNDATRGLLGKPGTKFPPAIELGSNNPFKLAKRDDGFYGFHIRGSLDNLDFQPTPSRSMSRPVAALDTSQSRRSAGASKLKSRQPIGSRLLSPQPDRRGQGEPRELAPGRQEAVPEPREEAPPEPREEAPPEPPEAAPEPPEAAPEPPEAAPEPPEATPPEPAPEPPQDGSEEGKEAPPEAKEEEPPQ